MQELKDLNVLIVDSSGHSKNLLRQILLGLGVTNISPHGSTAEALDAMRLQLFHVAFCDENSGPLEATDFIKALRSDLETRNVVIPVVLVTCGADFQVVAQWRDSGGSDVVVKPVSPMVIQSRLVALVLNPKPFVTTKTYIGPDRRREGERREDGERSPYGRDRRRNTEQDGVVFTAPRTIDSDFEPRT